MFEDLESETRETQDEPRSSKGRGSWAPLLGLVAFGILYVPFGSQPWGLYLAISGAYSVFVFGLAFGSAFRDGDDFFGNAQVPPYIAKLLIPHALILAVIVWGTSMWHRIAPQMPVWMTQEGHKGSLWYWCGALPLMIAGTCQGLWMAGRIKRRLGEHEE